MKHLSKLFLATLGMVSACPGISRSQYFTRQQLDDYERQKEQQRRLAQENRMKRVIVDLCKSKVKLVTDELYKNCVCCKRIRSVQIDKDKSKESVARLHPVSVRYESRRFGKTQRIHT